MVNFRSSFDNINHTTSNNYNNSEEPMDTGTICFDNDEVNSWENSSLRQAGVYGFSPSLIQEDDNNNNNNNLNQLGHQIFSITDDHGMLPSENAITDWVLEQTELFNKPKTVEETETVDEALDNLSFEYPCNLDEINNDRSYSSEFKKIKDYSKKFFRTTNRGKAKDPQFNQIIAKKNSKYNRYSDIVPYDKNTYQVSGFENPYINASQIDVNGKPYIACSAPTPHQFPNFWKMISDCGCNNIVMLANFMEKRRVKAHCYWPGEVGNEFKIGAIKISLESVENYIEDKKTNKPQLIKRTIKVTDTEEETERTISHWHFTGWPDFGVTTPDTFDKIINLVNQGGIEGPLVVHCSAGVGRAGTFVATHSLFEELTNNPNMTFSVAARVLNLRSQRNEMVQTEDQYKLIYDTIQYHAKN